LVASLYGRHRSRRASSRSLATRSNISSVDSLSGCNRSAALGSTKGGDHDSYA